MTNPAAQLLSELRLMTDPQARELHAHMYAHGQLPPPPDLCRNLSTPQAAAQVEALREALGGQFLAWGNMAPKGSAVMHYAHGLLYSHAFLDSAQVVESDPLGVLALFATWAAGFTRDVLTEGGLTETEIDTVLEGELYPALLDRLGGEMGRGAACAALACFQAGALTVAGASAGELYALFAIAGHLAAGPDFMPPSGEGITA